MFFSGRMIHLTNQLRPSENDMNKHPSWTPATHRDPAPLTDPRDKPLEYRVVQVGEVNRRRFESFAPGLVVTMLQPSDLTDAERKAFGIIGGAA